MTPMVSNVLQLIRAVVILAGLLGGATMMGI
jgi:hypothetical protein